MAGYELPFNNPPADFTGENTPTGGTPYAEQPVEPGDAALSGAWRSFVGFSVRLSCFESRFVS